MPIAMEPASVLVTRGVKNRPFAATRPMVIEEFMGMARASGSVLVTATEATRIPLASRRPSTCVPASESAVIQ